MLKKITAVIILEVIVLEVSKVVSVCMKTRQIKVEEIIALLHRSLWYDIQK